MVKLRLTKYGIAAPALAALVAACGGDDGVVSTLNIEIHGPDDSPTSQTIGFPASVDACVESLRFTSYQGTELVDQVELSWNASPATLPAMRYGAENWISVEGLSSGATGCPGEGDVVASGSTPRFTFEEGDELPTNVQVLTGLPLRFQQAFWFDGEESRELLYELVGQERAGHTITELEDGSGYVVIGGAKMGAGGITNSGITSLVDSIEFYDTYTGQFLSFYEDGCAGNAAECALRLPAGTAFHTATALEDGRVVIAGGLRVSGASDALLPTAEVWVLTPTGRAEGTLERVLYSPDAFAAERAFHTATRMADGRILLIGGIGRTYDPNPTFQEDVYQIAPQDVLEVTDTGADLSIPRALHTSTFFGRNAHGVVVIGGRGNSGAIGTSEVIYATSNDYSVPLAVDTFTADTASRDLNVARFGHSAVKYSCPGTDEEFVAIVGGYTQADGTLLQGANPTDTVEVYRPDARFDDTPLYEFSANTATLPGGGRAFGSALSMPLSGDLLFMGGIDGTGTVSAVTDRLFNQDWQACDNFEVPQLVPGGMGTARAHAAAVVLSNGFPMITGGFNGTGSVEKTEFYNPNDYSLVAEFY